MQQNQNIAQVAQYQIHWSHGQPRVEALWGAVSTSDASAIVLRAESNDQRSMAMIISKNAIDSHTFEVFARSVAGKAGIAVRDCDWLSYDAERGLRLATVFIASESAIFEPAADLGLGLQHDIIVTLNNAHSTPQDPSRVSAFSFSAAMACYLARPGAGKRPAQRRRQVAREPATQ